MNINILVIFVLKEIVISEISRASTAGRWTGALSGTNFRKVSKGKVNSFCQAFETLLGF